LLSLLTLVLYVQDQEGSDKEDKEGQSDDKEAAAAGEVEELTDEE